MKIYTKYNFHKYTFCVFKEVDPSEIADLKINYTSKSGSSYIFTTKGVFRTSNHWGRAANCKWRLQTQNLEQSSRTKVGYANWEEFHSINETDKLYFIEVNFEEKSVQYIHKNLSKDPDLYLRNATETAKRVKEIRNLLDNPKKLTYWDFKEKKGNLIEMVVQFLIKTDLTLLQIKQKLATDSTL